MKQFLLSSLALLLLADVQGQSLQQTTPEHLKKSKTYVKHVNQESQKHLYTSRTDLAPTATQYRVLSSGMSEEVIGETYYDLQTNSAIQNRLFVHDDNTISATWIMSPDKLSGFPNRGTGYNYFNGTNWLDMPTERVEAGRTGWPSISGLNGGEIIASHVFDDPNLFTTIAKRPEKGTGDWAEDLLPNSDGAVIYDNVWPRMKVGGADGQSVHVISHTYSLEPNNYITYSRSLDAGETYDIIDYLIPEIGPDYYNGFGGDSYALDVKGETVAFVLGDAWTDVILMKSTDNGSTWTKTIIREHPIPFFNDSIIVDSLNFPETNGIIENADQSYSISIDNDGYVHVFYGLMGYANDTPNDDQWSYYPTTDGLVYWNEITQEEQVIAYVDDANGNDTLDVESIDNIAYYGSSLTSYPSSLIAENGDIYLVYSSILEYLYDDQIDLGNVDDENFLQHYRHQYIMRSQDGGETWSTPYDLMAEITDPSSGDPLQEGAFGCISNIANDNVYLTYQRDIYPGLNIQGDEDPISKNAIVFMQVPIEDFDNLSTDEVILNNSDLTIYPNPSNSIININIANVVENATVTIYNVLGEAMFSSLMNGTHKQMSIESLSEGIYFLSIETPTSKLVKNIVKR